MRKKAADVFSDTDTVFSEKVSFETAFSTIDDLSIKVEGNGKDVGPPNNKSVYTKTAFPGEYINCNNSRCCKGGFSIGNILRDMVRNSQTNLVTPETCQGYEGSPEGRKRHGPYRKKFKIEVTIKYKQ